METRYCLVDTDTLELYTNQFGGELPPITESQIKEYFHEIDIETITKKYSVKLYPLDEKHLCRHCKTPLAKSDIDGYVYQCFYCAEDFYGIEAIEKDGNIYKLINKDTKDLYLGTEKAVIKFANDLLHDKDKKWVWLFQNTLLDLGFVKKGNEVEDISNINLAIKFLEEVEDYEVFDIGDILNELQNNELILLSQEE